MSRDLVVTRRPGEGNELGHERNGSLGTVQIPSFEELRGNPELLAAALLLLKSKGCVLTVRGSLMPLPGNPSAGEIEITGKILTLADPFSRDPALWLEGQKRGLYFSRITYIGLAPAQTEAGYTNLALGGGLREIASGEKGGVIG